MENLIRIKLDPRRGGTNPHDFIRPSFCLSNWPSDQVEIWISEDDENHWQKINEDYYRAGYDPDNRKFYVTLMFDITATTYIGFFSVEGNVVGIGYEVTRYDTVGLGWAVEGTVDGAVNVGWGCGDGNIDCVGIGFSVYGDSGRNIPAGYTLKSPEVRNIGTGGWLAAPNDTDAKAGFSIGGCMTGCVPVGAWILGLWEIGGDIIPFDGDASSCLCGEGAWRKQKTVELSGTIPEELD